MGRSTLEEVMRLEEDHSIGYSPANNSWSPVPISTNHWFAMTTLNNQLITAGGRDRSGKVTNKIFSVII